MGNMGKSVKKNCNICLEEHEDCEGIFDWMRVKHLFSGACIGLSGAVWKARGWDAGEGSGKAVYGIDADDGDAMHRGAVRRGGIVITPIHFVSN